MEMLRLLANDHQQADRLLKQLQAAREKAEQRWLFIELKHKLETYAHIEEEILYPALRASQGFDDRIDDAMVDHAAIRSLLWQMEQAIPGSERWVQSLDELKSKIGYHVQQEARALFPKVQSILTPQLQDELFERMVVRKAELAGQDAGGAWHGPRSEKAGEATGQPSEQAYEYARRVGVQGAGVAADVSRRLANALRASSENLAKEGEGGLSGYLREAANGLNRFSNWLTRGDMDSLLQETRDTAKRHPALWLGGAIAAGFLLARLVKSPQTSHETASNEVHAGSDVLHRVPTETPCQKLHDKKPAPANTLFSRGKL